MSEPINDGGPAFPCNWVDTQPTTGDQVIREQFYGMSLRDCFAKEAMGMIAEDVGHQTIGDLEVELGLEAGSYQARWNWPELLAKRAYEYADAMLKAREAKS